MIVKRNGRKRERWSLGFIVHNVLSKSTSYGMMERTDDRMENLCNALAELVDILADKGVLTEEDAERLCHEPVTFITE